MESKPFLFLFATEKKTLFNTKPTMQVKPRNHSSCHFNIELCIQSKRNQKGNIFSMLTKVDYEIREETLNEIICLACNSKLVDICAKLLSEPNLVFLDQTGV